MKIIGFWGIACISFLCSAMVYAEAKFPEAAIQDALIKVKNEHVEVQTKNLKAGEHILVKYANYEVFIYRRTKEQIEYLRNGGTNHLYDPENKNSEQSLVHSYGSSLSYVIHRLLRVDQQKIEKKFPKFRSIDSELAVFFAWYPDTGFRFLTVKDLRIRGMWEPKSHWLGKEHLILFDPRFGSGYDSAGRLLTQGAGGKRTSGNYNLYIPPHSYKEDGTLIIGLNSKTLPDVDRGLVYGTHLSDEQKLERAAQYNDINVINALLEKGTQPTYRTLSKAIIGSSDHIVRLFVEKGAPVRAQHLELFDYVERKKLYDYLSEKVSE